jgi:hypothetical protein
MTIGAIGGASAASQTSGVSASGPIGKTAFDQILEAFKKEAAKTPAQRARDEVLKKHNLSEDGYRALPPEQKKAVDAEIAIAAQRAMQADRGKGFKHAASTAAVSEEPTESGGLFG